MIVPKKLIFDYKARQFGKSWIIHADCLEWLSRLSENSLHAIVTDPPYGVKEYDPRELEKRLTKREYPKKKINENVEAELIDYCTQLAEKNLTCPVYELDTTKSNPKKTIEEIELILKGKGKRFKAGSVDWSKLI